MCVDAGGGRFRGGKFLRSMSDFKPGERTWRYITETCDRMYTAGKSCCPELSATPAIAGFILHRKEKRGAV